jgi:hypothetical protein
MILQIIKSNNKLVGEKINMMNARERGISRLCVKKKAPAERQGLTFS